MKKLLGFAEICFVVIGFTFFTGGFALGGTEDGTVQGLIPPIVATVVRYFVQFICTLYLMLQWKKTLYTMSRDWVLWIVVSMMLLSFSWSDLPEWVWFNASREIVQMVLFGLYLATRFTLSEQVRLLVISLMFGGITSTALALAMPGFGTHLTVHPGAWKGIYDYKNTFGSMMILGGTAVFLMPIENAREKLWQRIGIGACMMWILLTTSKTALVLMMVMAGVVWFARSFRWKGRLSVVFLNLGTLIVGCITIVLANTWMDIVKALGRDITLSGRTVIWTVALTKIQERPWLGFGRSAFWAPESYHRKLAEYFFGSQYMPPHSHNGFIDTALDIGLIGLGLFLISFVAAYILAFRRAYATKHPENIFPFAFLTFLALNNMTESYLFRLANVYIVLFVAMTLSLRKLAPEQVDEEEAQRLSGYDDGSIRTKPS